MIFKNILLFNSYFSVILISSLFNKKGTIFSLMFIVISVNLTSSDNIIRKFQNYLKNTIKI